MGTDIHMFLEYYVNGEWVYPANHIYIDEDKDYEFFALLGGARREYYPHIRPVIQGRGLPKDLSQTVHYESALEGVGVHGYIHCANYLTLEELQNAQENILHQNLSLSVKKRYQNLVHDLEGELDYNSVKGSHLHPSEIRIVFWFDN